MLRPLVLFILLCWTPLANAQLDPESPRMTPLVKVIAQIEPSMVSLFTPMGNQIVAGSGMIIHRDGYILTNHHVLPKPDGWALVGNRRPLGFEVVARLPESDIAIIKLNEPPADLQPLPLGRSADLLNGETVVVAGNPGGRGIVFTSGIVSSKEVLEGGPNALVMTNYENSRRDRFIQFDAASNRGNSGGPLVNMDGQVIGVVSAGVIGEQNVGLAIPIDRVRAQFERMLESETVHQRQFGLSFDPLAKAAVLSQIKEHSPAAKVDLQVNDRVLELNGLELTSGIDAQLRIDQLLASGTPLRLRVQRDGSTKTVELSPEPTVPAEPKEVAKPRPGLKVRMIEGQFSALPDFRQFKVVNEGICTELKKLSDIHGARQDYFALSLEGFLKIDDEGLYRLILLSDDGSKLSLGDKLLIDNDGNHPPKPVGRIVRLKAGFYPLRIEYFQGNGDKTLRLYFERVTSPASIGLEPYKEVEPSQLMHEQ